MRVVLATRIFSPEPAAASYILDAIARAFSEAGHDVTVLTVRPPRHMRIGDAGLRVHRAPVLRDASGYVRGYLPYLSFDLPLFFRLIFSRRADLYFVEPPPTSGAVMRVATALLRRPYFYDAADIWSDAARMATSSSFVLSILRRVEVFAIRGARRAFTISPGVSARMRELQIATPTTVIAFGADSEVFRYEAPQASDSPYFLYAGTYSEWHGAEIFIDAFAAFSRTRPEYRLIYVGNGSERRLLEQHAREAGVENIEFREPIEGERLNGLLVNATASLASLRPGHGYDYAFTTKVYSSIAAGCPVVFSGVGPTIEFLADANSVHTAGLATPYVAADVAAAMTALVETAPTAIDRERLSDWAREQFSLRGVARTVVERAVADVEERGR